MRKELGAIIAGIGVEVIFLILSVQVKEMPVEIAIGGYVVGGLLIIYGIVCVFQGFRRRVDAKKIVGELLKVGIFTDCPVNILKILYHDRQELKIGLPDGKVLASNQDKLVYGELRARNIVLLEQRPTGELLSNVVEIPSSIFTV